MTARIDDLYPSKSQFLKASDLKGREVEVTISRWSMEQLGDDKKPALWFRGKEKGLALNKTNARRIADTYGDDLDEWPGLKIILYVERVEYQGKLVDGLRVRVPLEAQRAAQGQPPVDEAPDYDDSDGIPF